MKKMGLDQYLYQKLPEEEMKEVFYWRKSNHFHKWFVDNCQNENDDCGTYPVSWEQLQELLDIINKILYCEFKDNKKNILSALDKTQIELAEELLPTQSGFFFGGTEYDVSIILMI
jgi:hypothetical protein